MPPPRSRPKPVSASPLVTQRQLQGGGEGSPGFPVSLPEGDGALCLQRQPQPRHRGLGGVKVAVATAAVAGGGAHRQGIGLAREGQAVRSSLQQGAVQTTGRQPQVQVRLDRCHLPVRIGMVGRYLRIALAIPGRTPHLQPVGETVTQPGERSRQGGLHLTRNAAIVVAAAAAAAGDQQPGGGTPGIATLRPLTPTPVRTQHEGGHLAVQDQFTLPPVEAGDGAAAP